jgi:hypothetical protein
MSEITSIITVQAAVSWSAAQDSSEIPFKDEHGKTGADYLRESIVEATIKRHPLACREEILQAMDDMGF